MPKIHEPGERVVSVLESGPPIRDVWNHNLEEELDLIMELVEKYPNIAMDCEFPGIIARPVEPFKGKKDYVYGLVRTNVNLTKLIQFGISFVDPNGNAPPFPSTWQFNMKFSVSTDMYAEDSIQLLEKAGLSFDKLESNGIEPQLLAENLIVSGLVLNPDICWMVFHGGYDFAYMLQLLIGRELPDQPSEFFALLRTYFPQYYDIKHLMQTTGVLRGGLQALADNLQVSRRGPQHQAGSDAQLTARTFFELKKRHFGQGLDPDSQGIVYGFGGTSRALKTNVY